MSRADEIRRRISELSDELRRIESWPVEPEEGTVIRFHLQFCGAGRTYHYAAIRAGGKWYLTGSRAPQHLSWEDLLTWMTNKECSGIEVLKAGAVYHLDRLRFR